ncbi:SPX and EXS domain-containing protein 1-like [Dorcoceras hygrometricum]|uniref:SPX and EXS domain-containing protein 1-like n=1 Tax=Dorcoceras hygrometricum TaxID=472368 RepID=A0A2Z7CYI8_9LAMI|nr:SPX and EXS domain-containing protein 1-like [Dorcoceras hygrometricum]
MCGGGTSWRTTVAAARVRWEWLGYGYAAVDRQSGPRPETIFLQSACTRKLMDFSTDGNSSSRWPEQVRRGAAARGRRRRRVARGAAESIGYPRMRASGESSTTKHRLLHASGSHPIPPPNDPKTNQYNQDLGLIHSTNVNHLESPNEGSSIDHQVTIHLHAQNITMFPTNETWYFTSQMLVSSYLILILTAQSTRNMFRIHSDY